MINLIHNFGTWWYKTMGWREGNIITALEEAIVIWLEAKKVILKNAEPWPEEEQALKDIKTGKTQMVTQKSEGIYEDLARRRHYFVNTPNGRHHESIFMSGWSRQ